MLIKDKIIRKQRDQIIQLVPKQFSWLCSLKKIKYNNVNLKVDYLINIMHELIFRYLTTSETTHNIWSIIFRHKYGQYYNYYIDWLVENEFMFFVSDYFVNKKTRSYRLNITDFSISKCKVTDKVLLKKFNKEYLIRSFTDLNNSPIELPIRTKLVQDLEHIEIDYDAALNFITTAWHNNVINKEKYYLNEIAIDAIKTKNLFFTFDGYGRFHTNFTILKKEIRKDLLTIDNEEICELDIKNSQPFFFGIYMKNEIGVENLNRECLEYIELINNGLLYDYLYDKFPKELYSREDAKQLVYKVLFGTNNIDKENAMFKSVFPTVLSYIGEVKSICDSYKGLSHILQRLESDFIYSTVVKDIYKRIPEIHIFTVHDSIYFPCKYKDMVELIFNHELNKLKQL